MKPDPTQSDRPDSSSADADPECYVLGGGVVGTTVARRLQAVGRTVSVIDESHEPSEISGFSGDPADPRTLIEAEIPDASTVVVATDSDRRNLLIAQLVRAHLDVSRVVVLVNDPDRLDAFIEADHETVCATTALSDVLVDSV